MPDSQIVAAVVASHPGSRVSGRKRLQKEIALLQRLGLPADYAFRMYYYGPYSDDLHSDLMDLSARGLLTESISSTREGYSYSVFAATKAADPQQVAKWKDSITLLASRDITTLELAATFCAYRDLGLSSADAWAAVEAKKPDKFSRESRDQAVQLIRELGLGSVVE